MKIYPIETGNLRLDGGAMFGVVPKTLWQKLYPCDENNLCNWAMRCLLVVDEDRKILVDNGIGDKQDEKFLKHYYLNGDDSLEKSLAKHGFTPDDITDMILTHLHFDHCGGSIKYADNKKDFELAFKNANYWVSKKQYNWAVEPNHRESASYFKENILPIEESGHLKLIEEEGEILPNISVKIFDGHTDGQVIPYINYHGKTIAFMADLLPAAAHIPLPWIPAYDTRPLLTLKDKEKFYQDVLENDITLFFEHDLYNECCTLQKTEKGVRMKETFSLNDFIERADK
ncbi:MAG: MBL fold metallo-hydrolase [Bacteroidales bacterium]|nr:MBL fold metallo-hydrolase [Bacteroidales bacterium]